jgi:hypothetical protein
MRWQPVADEADGQELRRFFEAIRAESLSRSEERSTKLAHRLIRSVLPLFVMDERDHLNRIGTCVLVRVGGRLFLLTAGHVLIDAGAQQLFAISGPKGRTVGLPNGRSVSHDGETEIDVGVIPLPAHAMSFFDGCTPIEGADINESYVVDHAIAKNSIYLIGYSASNSQVRVNHADKTVRKRRFSLLVSPRSKRFTGERNSPWLITSWSSLPTSEAGANQPFHQSSKALVAAGCSTS